MSISFNVIPNNILVPLFYAELDTSQMTTAPTAAPALLIGQKLAAGTAALGVPVIVSGVDQARGLFGTGSMLARMVEAYRANDVFGEIWCLPVADPAAGVAAAGAVKFTASPTEAGTYTRWIGGQRPQMAVGAGDTPAAMATAWAATVNAMTSLPVTAAVDGTDATKVNLTCRWKGATGNDISIIPNYAGALGGEKDPAGLTDVITAMAGGTGAPDLSVVVTAMGDDPYDHIVCPYSDTVSLDVLKLEMNDLSGRWSYAKQLFGHVWSIRRDTFAGHIAFLDTRNVPHESVWVIEPDNPRTLWEKIAEWSAQHAMALNNEPERPTQTLPLLADLPAPKGKRFGLSERQSLLKRGGATAVVQNGQVQVERARTTYKRNAYGDADDSLSDAEELFLAAYNLRFLRSRITQKFGRHALADDGTKFGTGKKVVTPKVIKAELTAAARALEKDAKLENADLIAKYMVVERDPNNRKAVRVLFPADQMDQLRTLGLVYQLRSFYQEAA